MPLHTLCTVLILDKRPNSQLTTERTSSSRWVASEPRSGFQMSELRRSLEDEADFSLPLGRSRQTFGSLSTHRLDNVRAC